MALERPTVAFNPPTTRRSEENDPEQTPYRPIVCEPRIPSRRTQKPPPRRPSAKSPFKRDSLFLVQAWPEAARRGHPATSESSPISGVGE